MEKMTRMAKYKDLRENLKKDVVSTEATQTYVTNEEIVKDANYYRNIVGDESTVEKKVEITTPVREDTLYETLTFDTITENEKEEMQSVFDKVRETNGQEQYNTRMDILNKIRQSKVEVSEPMVVEETPVEVVVEDIVQTPSENRFGYIKEEIQEEIKEIEEEIFDEDDDEDEVEETPKKRFGFFKRKDNEEVEEDDEEEIEEDNDEDEEDDDDEEESSFMVKLLNGCIIVLVLVLIGLVGFIAKEILL